MSKFSSQVEVTVGGHRYQGELRPIGSEYGSGVITFLRLIEWSPGQWTTTTRYPELVAHRIGDTENFKWSYARGNTKVLDALIGTTVVFS